MLDLASFCSVFQSVFLPILGTNGKVFECCIISWEEPQLAVLGNFWTRQIRRTHLVSVHTTRQHQTIPKPQKPGCSSARKFLTLLSIAVAESCAINPASLPIQMRYLCKQVLPGVVVSWKKPSTILFEATLVLPP